AGGGQALRVEGSDTRAEMPETLERAPASPLAATPEATALVWEQDGARLSLSFQDVGARVGRLARELRMRGVGPGARVAISLERSPEMVVAVLATLAAG